MHWRDCIILPNHLKIMTELVYPYDVAPMVPPYSINVPQEYIHAKEWFPVVEPSGLVVGRASRAYCHSGAKPLHPVVHLHIIDRFERLYLQKRSVHKDIQPGKWDTAVGGHVDYGESILEALFREASEELGFREFNPVPVISYVFESQIEKEYVNVFAAVGNFSLVPDLDEVEEGRWWPLKEIEENFGKSVFTPNFEQEFARIKDSLAALL